MRPADVEGLCINYYKPNDANWYNSKYSWYCTGYAKNKNNEPRPFLSMEKKSGTGSRITYLDPKGYPKKISILVKGGRW